MEINSYDSQKILEYIGEGILYTDKTGKILFINNAAEKITGWSKDDSVGRRIEEVFRIKVISSQTKLDSYCYDVLKGDTEKGLPKDTVLEKKDLSYVYLSAKITSVRDEMNNICGMVIVFRDISRLRSIEDRLSSEQRNFKTRFETAPVGMLLADKQLNIKDLNRSMLRMMDKEIDECIGKRFGDAFGCKNSFDDGCGNSKECCECLIQGSFIKLVKNNEEYVNFEVSMEIILRNKPVLKCLEINVTKLDVEGPDCYLLVIDDITEKKKMDEALIRSRNYYVSLFENFPILLWRADLNFKGDYFNNNWLVFTGRRIEQEIGNGWMESIHPEDFNKCDHIHKMCFNNRENIEVEFRLRHNDGSYHWVKEFGRPIYDLNDEFAGYIVAVNDISKHKNMMYELEKAKDEAEAANKAKSQFLANMSHEIRTPLNGMVGMIDLTLMGALKQEQRENLKTAKACVDSLLNIINDILDFSKIEAGKMEIVKSSFRLEDFMEETVKLYRIKAHQQNVRIDYIISKLLPEYIVGDKFRIKQILNNLLSNALKFTSVGSINLNVDLNSKDSSYLLFEVSDTGVGIAEHEVEKLFRSFTQLDSSYTRKFNGTGLGLAISKKLVEKMGGDIWVESKKDVGSKFLFTLKLEAGTIQESGKSKETIEYKSSKKLYILVVDDDKVNQTVLERMLIKLGHKVEIANNGIEAVRAISNYNFDLVFMDIQMPEMDGVTATEHIREIEQKNLVADFDVRQDALLKKTRLPIIALTAYAIEGDKEKFLKAGMDYYLSKPIIMSELLNAIEKVINDIENTEIENIILSVGKFIEPRERIDKKFIYQLIVRLKTSLDDNDLPLVERQAHLLKEYIERFDAKKAYENALKIELSARKNKADGIRGLIDKIENDIN